MDRVAALRSLLEGESDRDGVVCRAAAAAFDELYDRAWRKAASDERDELDSLYDRVGAERLPNAQRSDAAQARQAAQRFREGTRQDELLRSVLERRTWVALLRADRLPMPMVRKGEELSAGTLRTRLLHDVMLDPARDGSYWNGILQDVVELPAASWGRLDPWRAEGTKVANRLSYLCAAIWEMGEGGRGALAELRAQLVSAGAGRFLEQLTPSKAAESLHWQVSEDLAIFAIDKVDR